MCGGIAIGACSDSAELACLLEYLAVEPRQFVIQRPNADAPEQAIQCPAILVAAVVGKEAGVKLAKGGNARADPDACQMQLPNLIANS